MRRSHTIALPGELLVDTVPEVVARQGIQPLAEFAVVPGDEEGVAGTGSSVVARLEMSAAGVHTSQSEPGGYRSFGHEIPD